MGFIIRKATVEDLDVLILLMEMHAAFEKAVFIKDGKKEKLAQVIDGTVFRCFVVEEDKQLAGYFSYTIDFSTWDADFFLHLDCLFLKEETRGKGIGKAIIEFLKKEAVNNKCTNIQWQTPDFNYSAINFYKKMGARSKTKKRFYLSPE
jgi:GNAT superfamily N-acetyltransferase